MSGPKRPKGKYRQALRLVDLYDRLHRGGAFRPDEAAASLGVTPRTLYRDLERLREVLDDRLERIEESDGRVRWRLRRDSDRWGVTEAQVLAVVVGARMTGFLSGRAFASEVAPVLDQLRSSLNHRARGRVRLLERRVHATAAGQKDYRKNEGAQQRLKDLAEATLLCLPAELDYLSHRRREGGLPPRRLRVHPRCLALHRGGAYFVVDVMGGEWAGETRILLALDRIGEVVLDRTDPFEPDTDFDPEQYFAASFGIVDAPAAESVEIQISREMAPYFQERRWHSTQVVIEQADGGLRITMDVCPSHEVEEWVLGMGEHAQVVSPAWLRTKIKDRLTAALNRLVT